MPSSTNGKIFSFAQGNEHGGVGVPKEQDLCQCATNAHGSARDTALVLCQQAMPRLSRLSLKAHRSPAVTR